MASEKKKKKKWGKIPKKCEASKITIDYFRALKTYHL